MKKLAFGAVLMLLAVTADATTTNIATCIIDASSGLQVPTAHPGLCVTETPLEIVLAQKTEHGLLFYAFLNDSSIQSFKNLYQMLDLSSHTGVGRVIYCPSNLVEAETGMPGPACLSDRQFLIAGQRAFVGDGRATGSIGVTGRGMLSCSSTLSINASVSNRGLAPVDLNSSILLTDAESNGCIVAYSGMTMKPVALDLTALSLKDGMFEDSRLSGVAPENLESFQRAADALDRYADMSEAELRQADGLMNMDDARFQLAVWMTSARPEQIRQLARLIESDGVAYLADDGQIYRQSEFGPAVSVVTIDADTIEGIFDTILAIIRAVGANTNRLLARIPDNPTLRKLANVLPIAELQNLLTIVREQIGGVIALIQEMRAGFENFNANVFRAELSRMISNIETIWLSSQSLICLEVPEFTPRELKTDLIQKLIEIAPDLLLYILDKVLVNIDDWQLDNLVAAVPVEANEFCENEPGGVALKINSASVQKLSTTIRIKACDFRRKFPLEIVEKFVNKIVVALKLVEPAVPDDIAATAGVTAVAGAAAGTKVQNPADLIIKMVTVALERTNALIDQYQGKRAECLANDDQRERDLQSCTYMAGYVANQDEVLVEMRDLVDRRITDVEDAGEGIRKARAKLTVFDRKLENGNFRSSFSCLCESYRELTHPVASKIPFGNCN